MEIPVIATCTAPVNIAVIKYWGKRDEKLILPLNDSISFTLCQDDMCAKTTVAVSPHFTKDRFWLNGKEESLDQPRIQNCLKEIRRFVAKRKLDDSTIDLLNWHLHICSKNNFPTAAGLASSAAGYACLVFTLAQVYKVDGDLSVIARQGSGSACRSIYGGLVRWHKGKLDDGSDSIAKQIHPQGRWSNLHVIICVVNDCRKKTSSTSGMQRSVETSALLKFRSNESVNNHIKTLFKAIETDNWSDMCDVVMADSNQMHAVVLDSFPPSVYMNDTSHEIVNLIHAYNEVKINQKLPNHKVCYTFDAGPNACLFIPRESIEEFVTLLMKCFPSSSSTKDYVRGTSVTTMQLSKTLQNLSTQYECKEDTLKYLIHTSVGDGPRILNEDHHLLDKETGLPLSKE